MPGRWRIAGGYRRIYHYHLRKTGGTSLDSAFWGLAGRSLATVGGRLIWRGNGYAFVHHNRRLLEQGRYFFGSSPPPGEHSSLAAGHVHRHSSSGPAGAFAIPLSYLLWARDAPEAQQREPMLNSLRGEIEWVGSSFADFLLAIPKEHLFRQLRIFSDTYDVAEAEKRILSCSAVCTTELLAQDLNALADRLNLPLVLRQERAFRHPIEVPPADLDRARDILKPEFLLYSRVFMSIYPRPIVAPESKQ